jgi:pyruvate/2-oxoglutarate dehydrogenase complex dihydrolipoamide acyltransferase (E2) component
MQAEIILPELGAEPVTVSAWFADAGETIFAGDRLVEVLVGGATFDVSSPGSGRLVQKLVLPRESVRPGQVLGLVELHDNL